MTYYAKSNPVQTLQEHTEEALEKLKELKQANENILSERNWNLLRTAVYYHDFGKIDVKYQNMIRKAIGERLLPDPEKGVEAIPHNYMSGCFIDREKLSKEFNEDEMEIIYKSIFYHHSRQLIEDEQNFIQYVKKHLFTNHNDFVFSDYIFPPKPYLSITREVSLEHMNSNPEKLKKYILIKGFLNRIDYAASGNLCIEEPYCCDGMCIGEKTLSYMRSEGLKLRPMQEYMRKNWDENVVVVASTGSGKTEGALLWMNNAKSFYTLPFKVSINEIHKRITGKIGFEPAKVLHSDALSLYLSKHEAEEDPMMLYSTSKILASPLTVCTIDQLFKFVFKFNGGEMALATLSYSKLVIDEIQAYNPDIIAILLVGLKKVVELGGKFAIITATFPPVLYDFMDKLDIMKRPVVPVVFHGDMPKRHRIRLIDDSSFNKMSILDHGKSKRVLVLTNTIKNAQELYENLDGNGVPVFLLHSGYLKKDRILLEQNIVEFAPNKEQRDSRNGIWISTQIVEASLDIDFDILFTEMCSIEALLQRMGRAWRHRLYTGIEPNIFILNNRNGVGLDDECIIHADIYDRSLNAIRKYDGQLIEESDKCDIKQLMINDVYGVGIENTKYYQTIEMKIKDLEYIEMYSLTKKKVNEKFRDIRSITLVPKNIYVLLEDKQKYWRKVLSSKTTDLSSKQRVKEEISMYTVNVSHYHRLDIDYSSELFYRGSQIYLYNGEYDFDAQKLKGVGLKRSYVKNIPQRLNSFI